ncbi:MAG: TonB-dependent receptor [Halieaceae bacterium]
MNKYRKIQKTLLAVAVAAQCSTVFSQQLEEVLVTAQKRSQSLLDVPLSISSFSGNKILEIGALDVKDIVTRTPGLAGFSKDSFVDSISVRGISTNDFGVGGDPSIAIFQNGVYSGRSGEALTSLYDVERVEVLRGPQGLLFGRNATSGAIHVVTKKAAPGDTLGGEIGLGGGERGQLRGDFAVNVPVGENLGFRFSGYHSEEDGYVENLVGGDDLISHDTDAFRLSTVWSTERLSMDLVVDYEDREMSSTIYSGLDEVGKPFTRDHTTVAIDVPNGGYDESEVVNVSLNIGYEMSSMDFVSITGFRTHEFDYREDTDGTPVPLLDYIQDQEGDYFSQEFRLVSSGEGPWQWNGGVSGFAEEIEADFSVAMDEETICLFFVGFPCGAFIPGFQPNPIGLVESGTGEGDSWGMSVFGDVSYALSDQWKISVGARYSYDEKEFTMTSSPLDSELTDVIGRVGFLYSFTTLAPVETTKDWDYLNPRVLMEFTPSDDWLLYGSVTNGTKPGAFDSYNVNDLVPAFPSPLAAPGTDVQSVDEEDVWSYEIGARGAFADGRGSFTVSAFYYDYTDLQLQIFEGTRFVSKNVGEAEGTGVEMEVSYNANDYVQLNAGGAWLDTEVDDVGLDVCSTPDGGSCNGNSLPASPEYTASADLRFSYPIGNSLIYFVSEVIYSDSFYGALSNSSISQIDSWTEWNFRLGADIGEQITVSLFVDNAFDEEHFDGVLDTTEDLGYAIGIGPARPQTWGADVRYRFGP